MIFSRSKLAKPNRFNYQPRYAKSDEKEERTISFRREGAFLARKEELAGSMSDEEAVADMANRFGALVAVWERLGASKAA